VGLRPLLASGSLDSTWLRRLATLATESILAAPGVLRCVHRRARNSYFTFRADTARIADIALSAGRILASTFRTGALCRGNLRRLTRALTPRFTTTTSDSRHVFAIATHGHSTLAASRAGFVRVEFVRGAFRVRGTPTLAGDLLLLRCVHARETAGALAAIAAGASAASVRVARGGNGSAYAAPRLADHVTLALTIGPGASSTPEAAVVIACSIRHYYSLP
jgi:hypothetical protein